MKNIKEKRDKATKRLLTVWAEFGKKSVTYITAKKFLESMSDEEFIQFMQDCKDKKTGLPIVEENFSPNKQVSFKRCKHLLKKYFGHELYSKLVFVDPETGIETLTDHEHFNGYGTSRVMVQNLESKRSLPSHSKSVDHTSGQVTGESKGSSITLAELQPLAAKHGDSPAILELVAIRGSKGERLREFEAMLERAATVQTKDIMKLDYKARPVRVAATYLRAALLTNNFDQ